MKQLSNQKKFLAIIIRELTFLFENDERYLYFKESTTPDELGENITIGFEYDCSDPKGNSVVNTCEILGIDNTSVAIKKYLATPTSDDVECV